MMYVGIGELKPECTILNGWGSLYLKARKNIVKSCKNCARWFLNSRTLPNERNKEINISSFIHQNTQTLETSWSRMSFNLWIILSDNNEIQYLIPWRTSDVLCRHYLIGLIKVQVLYNLSLCVYWFLVLFSHSALQSFSHLACVLSEVICSLGSSVLLFTAFLCVKKQWLPSYLSSSVCKHFLLWEFTFKEAVI